MTKKKIKKAENEKLYPYIRIDDSFTDQQIQETLGKKDREYSLDDYSKLLDSK